DYVVVLDAAALSPHVGANGEMTIEAWVFLDRLPQFDFVTGQNRRAVVVKGDGNRWEYGLNIYASGSVEFDLLNPNGCGYGGTSGGQIALGQWHHLVGTLKKGQVTRIYLDGQIVGERTSGFSGDTADGTSPLFIGRRGDGQFFDGIVDEVSIYNRALSSNEI